MAYHSRAPFCSHCQSKHWENQACALVDPAMAEMIKAMDAAEAKRAAEAAAGGQCPCSNPGYRCVMPAGHRGSHDLKPLQISARGD